MPDFAKRSTLTLFTVTQAVKHFLFQPVVSLENVAFHMFITHSIGLHIELYYWNDVRKHQRKTIEWQHTKLSILTIYTVNVQKSKSVCFW